MKQQAEYIARHTWLEVGQYTGDMNVDSWPPEKWHHELDKNHVLVMTMTIFKNLILQNLLRFSGINLLVFDECHHAVKNHDYVQIMRRFVADPSRLEGNTRILGLTASLIPSKCKPGDLEMKIEDLEKTLLCRTQTAADLLEVAKYATNPSEMQMQFTPGERDLDVFQLKQVLEKPIEFLDAFKRERKKNELYITVKLNLEDCLHVLINLGIWCANKFASKALEDLTNRLRECQGIFVEDWEKPVLHLGITHLRLLLQDSAMVLSQPGKENHTVDKVKKLLLMLGDLAVSSGEVETSARGKGGACSSPSSGGGRRDTEKLKGIIFTERRTTATFLCKLLERRSQIEPDLRHLRCGYVLGHDAKSGPTHLRREAKMKSKRQDEVLSRFRAHGSAGLNLLVSTSVVEEGVDVPRCNLVVRFDFPQNFRSYVQSKGRARARESQYVLFIPSDDAPKLRHEISQYTALTKELERVCHNRHVEADYDFLAEKVEPYVSASGATATINSSLSVVHR